uniref:Uncharacterized protein n=1 Tax=Lotharella oceanica TaxID=641309 RepID=A0A140GYS9_9EUKA|nr:hypothetical protein AN617_60 [Lotharella oceanica]AMN87101.1 hypothetical protein AN617_60 [Lotharella oceanica]
MSLQLPCIESRSHFILGQRDTSDKSNPLQTQYFKSRSNPSFTIIAANTNTKLHNDPNLSNTIKVNTDTTPRKDLGSQKHTLYAIKNIQQAVFYYVHGTIFIKRPVIPLYPTRLLFQRPALNTKPSKFVCKSSNPERRISLEIHLL